MTIHEKIKESEYILYKDDEILIVLDFDPITKGHVLILPKKSFVEIDEVPELILLKIFKAAQSYIKLINLKYMPKGYSIMQNGGKFNDIAVFHLHVFPRFKENEFGYRKKGYIEKLNTNELQKMMKQEINNYEREQSAKRL